MSQPEASGLAVGQDAADPSVASQRTLPEQQETEQQEAPPGRPGLPGRLLARPVVRELIVVLGFIAAGIAACWPRATFITGSMPMDARQAPLDVWSLWWVAHQVSHLLNPYFTTHLAAPVGVQLGPDTLMPLLGLVMTPVTLLFGPTAAYNVLGRRGARASPPTRCTGRPGCGCQASWDRSQRARSSACPACSTSQDWLHIHTAIGRVPSCRCCLRLTVRLRRGPTVRPRHHRGHRARRPCWSTRSPRCSRHPGRAGAAALAGAPPERGQAARHRDRRGERDRGGQPAAARHAPAAARAAPRRRLPPTT